jgi:hypothetical protein
MIMRLPVHTALWDRRAEGALALEIGVQASETGSYLPPVSRESPESPPHTIILLPLQIAVCSVRADGAPVSEVGVQPSVTGSYRPPVPR